METPEPIVTKFVTVDYAGEQAVKPNLVKIRPPGHLGKRVKYNILCDFLFIYFSRTNIYTTGQTPGRILTLNSSKEAESRKDVPFGLQY